MEKGNMKNIVILKDLPSNMIEEAIVVLKENKKIKRYQYVDSEGKKTNKKVEKVNNDKEYILKEAELVIHDYISTLETKSLKWKNNMKKLENKYKQSVKLNIILAFSTVISLLVSLIA